MRFLPARAPVSTRRARVIASVAALVVGLGFSAATMTPASAEDPTAPGAPTRVMATHATATSMDLSWSAPGNDGSNAIMNYAVNYRKAGDSSWSYFDRAASTVPSVTVTGLTSGALYEFRVGAVNMYGLGAWSQQKSTIVAGASVTCVLLASGPLKCTGGNYYGQLGDGTTIDSSALVQVLGMDASDMSSTAVSVSVGGNHTCALMLNGAVKCWGMNGYYQMGDGTYFDRYEPIVVTGIDGLSRATTAVTLSSRSNHSCAAMADGTVKCWGYNDSGQLGDGSSANRTTPVLVQGIDGMSLASTAMSISTGGSQTCAVMGDGTVMCWGRNLGGQLGDGTTTERHYPAVVSGIDGQSPSTTATSVSTDSQGTCAVMADGSVKCWGSFGSPTPVVVSGMDGSSPSSSAIVISFGGNQTCALMADGQIRCFGQNYYGNLGDGTTTDSYETPVMVSGITGSSASTTAVNVSTGGDYSCAVLADGSARCWGYGESGNFGNNETLDVNVLPVPALGIDGLSAATRVANSISLTLPGADELVPPASGTRVPVAKPVSRSLQAAPLATVTSGDKVSLAVNGLPSNVSLTLSRSPRISQQLSASHYVSLGTFTSANSGKAKLPTLRLVRVGFYTFKMTTPGDITYYLKVKVVRG